MKASKSNLAAALTGKLRANRMRRLVTQESESLSGHYTRLPEVNEKIVKMDETTIDERLPLVSKASKVAGSARNVSRQSRKA